MSGSPISFDLQLAGVLDDGTPEGAIRAKLATGELVPVPFSEGSYQISLTGTAGGSFNAGATPTNPDGSGSGIFVSLPVGSAASQQSTVIQFVIYGTYFGLRYALTAAGPDAGAMIDGVAYRLPLTRIVPDTQAVMAAGLDPEHLFEVASDLPDRPEGHDIRLVFPFDPVNGAYSLSLYGILVERRRGYQPRPRALTLYEGGLVPSVAARILAGTAGWRGLRKIIYHNTTAAPVDITITLSGNAIRVLTVPASGDAEWDLGEVTAVQRTASAGTGSLFHAAATTNVVRFTCLVGA